MAGQADIAAMHDPAPRILTLTLDPGAQANFDRLRRSYFPAERLFVGAHVTLFHALPGGVDTSVLQPICLETAPFPVAVTGVRFLGRGVAFSLYSVRLHGLRAALRSSWLDQLTSQDRQGWSPHVTIQNKVAPAVARTLHASLEAAFVPYQVMATGLALWWYRNGPWDEAGLFPFTG